jgi:hypothetical protein
MSSLLQTLLHPDHEEAEMKDRLVVISAANQLQVGEFQLLQLAYREWHGQDLPEALVAHLFTSYMLDNEVPHWARHYARGILDRHERGEIDDNASAFHRYDHEYHTSVPRGVQRFCVAVAGVILAIFGSIYVANQVVTQSTSLLPPYFDESDFRQGVPEANSASSDTREHFIAPGGAGNFSNLSGPGR